MTLFELRQIATLIHYPCATFRPGAQVSEGLRESYWRQGQATGLPAAYHALGAFSETDFRDDPGRSQFPRW
jgi:hypothetical protein